MMKKICGIMLILFIILGLMTGVACAYEQNGFLLGLRKALRLGDPEDPSITIGQITLAYANLEEDVMQEVTIPVTTVNIPDETELEVKLVKNGLDIDKDLYEVEGGEVENNSTNILLKLGNELPKGAYYLEVKYVETIEDPETGNEIVDEKAVSNTTFTVTTVEVKSITIEDEEIFIGIGADEGKMLTYSASPNAITDSELIFESDNPKIATISEGGLVMGVARGETNVRILSADRTKSATCKVTVMAQTIEITEFTTTPETLLQGQEQEINITVSAEDFEIDSVLDVFIIKNGVNVTGNFQISGNTVNGNVLNINVRPIDYTTISSGKYTIKITYNEEEVTEENMYKQIREFTIYSENAVTGLGGEEGPIYMTPNSQRHLQVYVLPENANNKTIIYSTTDPAIATISDEGEITALQKGSTRISIYAEENSDIAKTIELKVIDLVESEEYIVDIDNLIVKNIPVNTTREEFLSNMQIAGDYKIYSNADFERLQIQGNSENIAEIESDELVGTGTVILVNGQAVKLVVKGDANGDGRFDIIDVSGVVLHIVEKSLLDGVYKLAADINEMENLEEGAETVDIVDLSQMILALVGKQSL